MHRAHLAAPTLLLAFAGALLLKPAPAQAQTPDDPPPGVSLSGHLAGTGVTFEDSSGIGRGYGAGLELRMGVSAGWEGLVGFELHRHTGESRRLGFLDVGFLYHGDPAPGQSWQRYLVATYTHWFGNPENPRNPEYDDTRSGMGMSVGAGYRYSLAPDLRLDVGFRGGVGGLDRPPPVLGVSTTSTERAWTLRPRIGVTWFL